MAYITPEKLRARALLLSNEPKLLSRPELAKDLLDAAQTIETLRQAASTFIHFETRSGWTPKSDS